MKEYRKYGFGRVLMEEMERYVAEQEDLENMKDILTQVAGTTVEAELSGENVRESELIERYRSYLSMQNMDINVKVLRSTKKGNLIRKW
jgi:hypothetical protein